MTKKWDDVRETSTFGVYRWAIWLVILPLLAALCAGIAGC